MAAVDFGPMAQTVVSMQALPLLPFHLIPGFALPASVKSKLPEAPIFCAGALGGPLCIGALTPLRNACTLAAQDGSSSAKHIFEQVFGRGLRSGWLGATAPATAAALQFTMLGPGYHMFLSLLGSPAAAVAGVATVETCINYAPSTRNAQLMHNSVCQVGAKVPLQRMRPFGPGAMAMLIRNCAAASGIRVLSDPIVGALSRVAPESLQQSGACKASGDFLASLCCGVVSMPFNQLYNFQVTSAASLAGGPAERARLGMQFLSSQYITRSAGGLPILSRIVVRDACLRASYVGLLYSSYAAAERVAASLWQA